MPENIHYFCSVYSIIAFEGREQGAKDGVLKGSRSLANWALPSFHLSLKFAENSRLLLIIADTSFNYQKHKEKI
jgi:hypothetical protein